MARFSRKSQKIKKIKIFENFWFFNEFPEFRINGKYKKPASLKNGKFTFFSRKLVHIFEGKKKDGFKKGNETRYLKMDLKKDGSSFEKVDLRLESLDLT